jgi:hypothetical protein
VPLCQASDVKPEEAAELIQVRQKDGTIGKLVEDKNSILHHLSQLRLRMSRLCVVDVTDKAVLGRIQNKVKSWCKPD